VSGERDAPPQLPPPTPLPLLTFSVLAPATERLDRFLADQLSLSRTQASRLVSDGAVVVNGAAARASRTLVRGDQVTVTFPASERPRQLRPAPIPLEILYEDEHLAVINKPAGLVVHPAPGHWDDTLVNALVARGTTLSGGAEGRPGIVHRLDRGWGRCSRAGGSPADTRHCAGDTSMPAPRSSKRPSSGTRVTASG
jgi:23S rRNA-/tRNA-specific pseudouridylate synthase